MHKTDDCMQVVQFPVFHIVIHSQVQTVLREYKVMSGYGGSVYLSVSLRDRERRNGIVTINKIYFQYEKAIKGFPNSRYMYL